MKHLKSTPASTHTGAKEERSDSLQQTPDAANSEVKMSAKSREELIQQDAYARYEARHGENGTALDDWLQAERTLEQGPTMLTI